VSIGVLAVHGFTGSPATLTPLTDALTAAGYRVSAPCLPGHGTRVEDMLDVTYADWRTTVQGALDALVAEVDDVVVLGQSMGAALVADVLADRDDVAGAVFVNPAVATFDPGLLEIVDATIEAGEEVLPGGRSDIADPDVPDGHSYAGTPLRPFRSLAAALLDLQPRFGAIDCPVLIMTATNDHVVDPAASDLLADAVAGPVERVTLDRSFHVATLDYDKQLVIDRTIDFVRKVTPTSTPT
jgi:carboxylesterase